MRISKRNTQVLGGLCLSKREAANGRGLTISCNSLVLIELEDNVLYYILFYVEHEALISRKC